MSPRFWLPDNLFIIWLLMLGWTFDLFKEVSANDDEFRLLQDLFERRDGGYNPRIRPVENINSIIPVGFELALIQLINLDERNQIMKTNVWLRLYWCDYQLKWLKSEYANSSVVRIQPDRVWTPDVVLYNNADGRFEVSFKANVLVNHNGWIMWIPCTIYKSSCSIDVTYFPFDEQICEMNFASWTYDSNEVKLHWYLETKGNETVPVEVYSDIDLSDYEKSGSWDLVEIPGQILEKDNKTVINYKIKLRRKTLFYTVNLIIPCFLISILSTMVFLLPAEAGEKTVMSVSILLALVVFLQVLVTNLLPPSSTSFPLFAKYLLFAVLLDVCVVFNTILSLNWHFKTPRTHRMPKWVRLLFVEFLPKILFINKFESPDTDSSSTKQQQQQEQQISQNVCSKIFCGICKKPTDTPIASPETSRRAALKPQVFDFTDLHSPNCALRKRLAKRKQLTKSKSEDRRDDAGDDDDSRNAYSDQMPVKVIKLEPEINKAVEAVRFISAHLKNEDDYEEVVDDWHYVAHVIDRLLLYVYLVVTIAATLAILLNAPNIYESINQDDLKAEYKKRHVRLITETNDYIYLCPWG